MRCREARRVFAMVSGASVVSAEQAVRMARDRETLACRSRKQRFLRPQMIGADPIEMEPSIWQPFGETMRLSRQKIAVAAR
jgi:hypothetical protein